MPAAEPAPQGRQPSLSGPDASAPQAEWTELEEDFGRWERTTQQCEIQLQEREAQAPQRLPCRSVRLDQQLAGLLSIRLLPATDERDSRAQQLVFAGVLLPGSQPMRCQDRRCQPRWPIRVQLSALATSNISSLDLPQARLVQGSCELESDRLLCVARDQEGRRWQSLARW